MSLLSRAFRQGQLDRPGLRTARREFYTHFPSIFAVVDPQPAIVDVALEPLNRYARHNITYPDSLHIASARYAAESLRAPDLVLVSADGPLLAVAGRLRMPTFNPERDDLQDVT